MNIADRIQYLRKTKGISQEELADKIGVSRQAVSKWESEQSMPDIDKVIIMSDYFGVTTDYIIKGIETKGQDKENKRDDTGIFSVTATAFNFIGLVVSAVVWYEEQSAVALAIGLIFMAMGCMIFGIGIFCSAKKFRKKANFNFFQYNVWLLTFIPFSFIYNILFTGLIAPYPLITSIGAYIAFWVVYVCVCLSVSFAIYKLKHNL